MLWVFLSLEQQRPMEEPMLETKITFKLKHIILPYLAFMYVIM